MYFVKYGKEYLGSIKKSKKTENIQDAHEAIRPTSILRTPESVKKYLKPDEFKLYNLIYIRTLSSLMADAKVEATSVDLENNDYIFRANGSILVFDGKTSFFSTFNIAPVTLSSLSTVVPEKTPTNEGIPLIRIDSPVAKVTSLL